jgi:hypothetical protein
MKRWARQASSLYRSLAYFHPEDTDKAVEIEKRLLSAKPDDLETWRGLGTSTLIADAWPKPRPTGRAWLRFIRATPTAICNRQRCFGITSILHRHRPRCARARERLAKPALFGYQAGAIEESQGNLSGGDCGVCGQFAGKITFRGEPQPAAGAGAQARVARGCGDRDGRIAEAWLRHGGGDRVARERARCPASHGEMKQELSAGRRAD